MRITTRLNEIAHLIQLAIARAVDRRGAHATPRLTASRAVPEDVPMIAPHPSSRRRSCLGRRLRVEPCRARGRASRTARRTG